MFGVFLQEVEGSMDGQMPDPFRVSPPLHATAPNVGWVVECRELMINLWLTARQPWYKPRWCKWPLPLDASTTLPPFVTTKNV